MNKKNYRVLVLNADYVPIAVRSWQQAFVLNIKGVVQIIDTYDDYVLDCKGHKYNIPAVVILKKYVKKIRKEVSFSRRNIRNREKGLCAYCGKFVPFEEETIDHIIPVSKWRNQNHNGRSPTSFENVCLCCVGCNRKKANRTPKEAGMTLNITPSRPKNADILSGLRSWEEIPKQWQIYLGAIK